MIYRPEQKNGEGKSGELAAYYERKQSVKHNQVRGEAEVLHDKDRNAEQANSKWEGASPKDRAPSKSATIWDDEAWKDKSNG